jgi:hypothetical protein
MKTILLPSISGIRRITKSLAMLDAILCPEWEYRYYSFDSKWGAGEEMASMRNGSGDGWFLLLNSTGAAIKGFVHELASDVDFSQNIQAQVPQDFSSFLNEPAFSMQHATFCYWRKNNESSWSKVRSSIIEDGSFDMLELLVAGESGYKEWAEDYYEMPVSIEAVEQIFTHLPLSKAVVLELNPDASLESVYEDAIEIGYPNVTAN